MTRGSDRVRDLAVRLLEHALASHAPVRDRVAAAAQGLDERDGRLLTELTLGTLRWLRRLDDVLERAAGRALEAIDAELLPVLRVAAYQILFLDRVPAYAAVDAAVGAARRRAHAGAAGFANAVLRRLAASPRLQDWPVEEADPIRRLAVEHSFPDFLVRRWAGRLDRDELVRVLEACNRRPRVHVLAFSRDGGREALAEELVAAGLAVEASPLSPLALRVGQGDPLACTAFGEGRLYVQNEASQLAALVPPPHAGETVLDVAASPGGKTFAMLAFEPSLRCTMVEIDPARLARLVANRRRLRLGAAIVGGDGASLPFRRGFDRVVVDAPCSGTGTFKKNPELKWRASDAGIARLAERSLAMVREACRVVRPGGLLVLVTCSLEPEENEGLVARLLAEGVPFARPSIDDAASTVPGTRVVDGLWRLWPGDENDGFSVSVLRREGP